MHNSRGNFLLQALLALTLMFAFVPFLVRRIADRDRDAQMYAATRQIEVAQTAAKIYIRENATRIPYQTTIIRGNLFADTLEPYGLPLGYVPKTPLGQDVSLVIDRDDSGAISAHLELTGGNLPRIRMAELARRLGFYAGFDDDMIIVGVPLNEGYSDIVRRDGENINDAAFLTNLDMGGFSIVRTRNVSAASTLFESDESNTITLVGVESGRTAKNNIANTFADKTTFKSAAGEAALNLTRGTLAVRNASVRTIAKYGDTGAMTADSAAIYDFSMTAGRSGFYGPAAWDVRGSVVSDNINFTVDAIEINGSLNATRGQSVYISDDTLEISSRSGIETGTLAASNITLRDQTSDAISRGGTGRVILDIRPAGTSVLPDVLIDGINNDAFSILSDAASDGADTIGCKTLIARMDGTTYNAKSLSQYIVCQYVYWARMEHRIDIKQCIMDGGRDCK